MRALAKRMLPAKTRKRINAAFRQAGIATGSMRALPDFLLIGAQKSGTSSLFYYLQQHPDVQLPTGITKEVHYFDHHHGRGENWYRGHFPLRSTIARRARKTGRPTMTFEATPEYLFVPEAPSRIVELLPGRKFVAVLRDPIDRAYSQYKMEVKKTLEKRSFDEAITAELDVLEAEQSSGVLATDFDPLLFWYVRRGLYAEQLERWFAAAPVESLLVLGFDELKADPMGLYRRVLRFIGLREEVDVRLENINEGGYRRDKERRLSQETESRLRAFLRPHNERLVDLIGLDFELKAKEVAERLDPSTVG